MKNNYNVVGDIAGNYLTLQALLAKMPKDAKLLSLGDPADRGPRSKEVIEFLMKTGKTVNSNHAHMLVEEWKQRAMPGAHPRFYEDGVFSCNGGTATADSYNTTIKEIHKGIPVEHIDFLRDCPMYIKSRNFVMTHAPLVINKTLKEACELGEGYVSFFGDAISDESLLWNRYVPRIPHPNLKGKINVFGHNSSDMVKIYTTQYPNGVKVNNEGLQNLITTKDKYPIYAICVDTSGGKILTGLHLPTMVLYQQNYID